MRNLTAIVVTGGAAIPASVRDDLPDSAWVVAADSGLEHARRIGLPVDVVVGDLDSVPEHILLGFSGSVEHHPADKDHTDLELALELVGRHGHIDRVIVLGGGGGRLDHLLGNVAALAAPACAHLRIEWLTGAERVHVVWDHVELHGHAGDIVSLVAIGGPALGVTTEGLRWPLRGARLDPSTSLGISNVMQGAVATVTVREGRLLTIQPDPEP